MSVGGVPIIAGNLPSVSMIDTTKAAIIGRTPPMWLVLGAGTKRPLRKWRARTGLLVIAGDGGVLHDLIIGTDTMREHFMYVDPLHQTLCWYPDGPQGKFEQLNGVPVSIHAGAHSSAAAGMFAAVLLAQPRTVIGCSNWRGGVWRAGVWSAGV